MAQDIVLIFFSCVKSGKDFCNTCSKLSKPAPFEVEILAPAEPLLQVSNGVTENLNFFVFFFLEMLQLL